MNYVFCFPEGFTAVHCYWPPLLILLPSHVVARFRNLPGSAAEILLVQHVYLTLPIVSSFRGAHGEAETPIPWIT